MIDKLTSVPVLNHGAIGNGQCLALVAPDTRIEWLCMPRFDSPSVFASLLDREQGGSWAFAPVGRDIHFDLDYLPNTNVLRNRIRTEDGECELLDFSPRIYRGMTSDTPAEVCRVVRPVAGAVRLRVQFDPRPNYGRSAANLIPASDTIEIHGGPAVLHLATNIPQAYVLNHQPLRLEQPWFFVLSYGRRSRLESVAEALHALDLTVAGWRSWSKTCGLPSFAPDRVLRSALCLKLHVYRDTGAIIAAATTSIPEALRTERTWDYRYCWLRDAAFGVEALRRLGHLAEGEAFVRFLRNVAEDSPLQPVYGIGGERNLQEEQLDHLAGFAGTRPVRIGNAASIQTQNDLMGEMVLCLETLLTDPRLVNDHSEASRRLLEGLVEQAIQAFPLEDTGIWEFRTRLRHYSFSKVLCWVAAHRGAELARNLGMAEQTERWEAWARGAADEILRRAYNERLGYFTQAFEGQFADASLLLLPTLGIIDAKDPRFVSTVRKYEQILVRHGLMLRYVHPDDLGETTSAFLICSFWWAEALAMMGELDRAVEVFERVAACANPLGLFSEDVEPESGRLLGNFPQAYTHVGLIHAAITIGELQEARDAKFRAWS